MTIQEHLDTCAKGRESAKVIDGLARSIWDTLRARANEAVAAIRSDYPKAFEYGWSLFPAHEGRVEYNGWRVSEDEVILCGHFFYHEWEDAEPVRLPKIALIGTAADAEAAIATFLAPLVAAARAEAKRRQQGADKMDATARKVKVKRDLATLQRLQAKYGTAAKA